MSEFNRLYRTLTDPKYDLLSVSINEFAELFKDTEYLMTEVSVKFLPTILLIAFAVLFYPLFQKLTCPRRKEIKRSIWSFIIVLMLFIIVGRGGFQRKPIAVIDAYKYGSASKGHLILNGIFTASHFSNSSKFIERKAGNENDYLQTLNLSRSKNHKYPLERSNDPQTKSNKKNLVLWIFPLILFISGGLLIYRKVFIN